MAIIQSIVCDGWKGLLQLFPEIPAQLCQFHQVKTVSRYLTRNPKTAAGKALWQLALTLKDSSKVAFQSALQAWFEQHQGFLNERTVNEESGDVQADGECVFEPENGIRTTCLPLRRIPVWAPTTPPICWTENLPT